jgi:hypothetical protein
MRLFEESDSFGESASSNALPEGLNSPPELVELYKQALVRQRDASEAWRSLMQRHVELDSPYSAVLHCAEASGLPHEELRERLGAPSPNLSRWFNGLAQPARMLRDRLNGELLEGVNSWISRIGAQIERLR